MCHGEVEVVETTVAYKHDLARYLEAKVIEITFIHNIQTDRKVGVAHIGALHIDEELLVEVILERVLSYTQAFQRQIICCKLSHFGIA